MSWPVPTPGLVIRYSYLWDREFRAGREEGVKDRPCAVVLSTEEIEGQHRVYVLPVTHTRPVAPDEAVELPMATKKRLGLDGERSWIVTSETNAFKWPGPDLRFLPGQGPASIVYGNLPPDLLALVQKRFVTLARQRKAKLVRRTD